MAASQPSQPKLANFLRAMQRIYAIPSSPPTSPWTPPPATSGHHGRYLWTDAFGVINMITLYRLYDAPHYLTCAKALVTTVHSILGRTRDLSSPLPGATATNPLGGGLRIGKDEATGPDGDGQYHHYLTLWMFALNRLSVAAKQQDYNDQAIALARAIHPAFVYARDTSRPRMYWKMSMDLRKPLVRSEGNLDPVDGLVVFRMLQETDRELWGGEAEGREVLRAEIEDYEKIVETKWRGYSSDDPLDLGMTLWTAHHYAQTDQWSEALVKQARRDLAELFGMRYFDAPTRRRLAFREFGTCLGIRCGAELAASEKERELWERRADSITQQWESAGIVPVPDETTRLTSHNSADHLMPITLVMYAAALIPGAFQHDFLDSS